MQSYKLRKPALKIIGKANETAKSTQPDTLNTHAKNAKAQSM
jgi:hypothetical protein